MYKISIQKTNYTISLWINNLPNNLVHPKQFYNQKKVNLIKKDSKILLSIENWYY